MLIDFNLIFDEICQYKEVYYKLHMFLLHFSLSATRINVEYVHFVLRLINL